MTDWTPEREAAAKARCEAATEGPWFTWSDGAKEIHWLDASDKLCRECGEPHVRGGLGEGFYEIEDAVFCAGARTDLPDAIREIKRLREELIDAWEHRALRCPCAVRQPHGDIQHPAPPEECTCGLKEALYGTA